MRTASDPNLHVRFLCDLGVIPRVTAWLRDAGHDATHLRDQRMHKLPDLDIIQNAAVEDRIVLSEKVPSEKVLSRVLA